MGIEKCTFLLDIFWKIKEDQESELVNSLYSSTCALVG